MNISNSTALQSLVNTEETAIRIEIIDLRFPVHPVLAESLAYTDYLRQIPPSLFYSQNLPVPSTTDLLYSGNISLLPWDNFDEQVLSWIGDQTGDLRRLLPHQWRLPGPSDPIYQESNIQIFFQDNICRALANLHSDTIFAPASAFNEPIKGKPDFIMWKNGSSYTFIELKGKWSVPANQNIRLGYETNRFVQGAVRQLYGYLVLNHRCSGVISTYDMTWFFQRRIEENEEHLYVTEGISINQQQPTLLEAFEYFITVIASNQYISSPPNSKRTSPISSRKSNSNEMISSPLNQSFSVDEISTGQVIGEGRSGTVFLADNKTTALKTLDVYQKSCFLPEVVNEIKIYSKLISLQGKVIPRFKYCGIWEGLLFVLGVDYVGNVPKKLSDKQKKILLSGLSEIHSLGVLHGDIRLENILVDRSGNPFIIDFASSSFETDNSKFEEEYHNFQMMISNL